MILSEISTRQSATRPSPSALFQRERETGPLVRLRAGAQPVTPAEGAASRLLIERGSLSLAELRRFLADHLLSEEQRQGGWAVDVGIWGSGLFQREADRLIAGWSGRLLTID
ncbi:MAG: hypothetical protein HYY04_12660 [Chloroflexi bacterium]|nr:hypothetical protein [Chloroflexota bacterium]